MNIIHKFTYYWKIRQNPYIPMSTFAVRAITFPMAAMYYRIYLTRFSDMILLAFH